MSSGDLLSDPSEQRRLLEAIYKIERAVTTLSGTTGRGMHDAKDQIRSLGDEATKAGHRAEDALKNVATVEAEMVQLSLDGTTKRLDAYDSMVKSMQDKLQSISKDVNESVTGRVLFGSKGPNAITGHFGGIQRDLQSMQSAVFSQLPAAGFLGLLMNGYMQKEEWKTKGEAVVQMFDGIERSTRASGARVGDEMRNMKLQFQTTEEAITATASALRAVGIAGSDMEKQVSSSLGGVTGSVYETLTHVDEEFKLAAGSSGQMVGALVSAGYNIQSATEKTQKYAEAARGAGIDTQALFGSITQLGMNLQLQRPNIDGAVKSLAAFRSIGTGMGLGKEASQAIASDMTGRIGTGIGNMDDKMSAFYGRIISQKHGMQSNGLAGLYNMATGFQGATGGKPQFDIMGEVLGEAISRSQRNHPGDDAASLGARMMMIQRLLPMASRQDAAMLANARLDKNGMLDKSSLPAGKESLAADLMNKQVALQTPTNVLLEKIQEAIARLGEALLTTLVVGFDMIVTTMIGLAQVATGGRSFSDIAIMQNKKMGTIKGSFDNFGGAAQEVVKAGGRMFGSLNDNKWGFDDITNADREAYSGTQDELDRREIDKVGFGEGTNEEKARIRARQKQDRAARNQPIMSTPMQSNAPVINGLVGKVSIEWSSADVSSEPQE